MSEFVVIPGKNFGGSVSISGSKNAALPAMAALICSAEESVLENVPCLSDTENMCMLIRELGCECEIDKNGIFFVSAAEINNKALPYESVRRLRASFLLMSGVLARCGYVKIPLPGGCHIGARPIDLHLKGFAAMGAEICENSGYIEASCKRLHGADIYLDFPSVGATENLMIAASLAKGITHIENAAKEPEIQDLAALLKKMGVRLETDENGSITVEGKESLHGCRHRIIPDRVEAGTFMTAAAICGGSAEIKNVQPGHLKALTAKLIQMGVGVRTDENTVYIERCCELKNVDIKTQPYPGFPTDLQAPFSALMTVADGTGTVSETIFENRFQHIGELSRMGAKVSLFGRNAVITGRRKLMGARLRASDLRAGAALVVAAMGAEGESRIENIEHIERGYENFEEKLRGLGVDINKILSKN